MTFELSHVVRLLQHDSAEVTDWIQFKPNISLNKANLVSFHNPSSLLTYILPATVFKLNM